MPQSNLQGLVSFPMLRIMGGTADTGGEDTPDTGGDEDIPLPVTTMINRADLPGEPAMFSVNRAWRAADARRCTLCEVCTATFFSTGFAACAVPTVGTLADGEGPLYRRATSSAASSGSPGPAPAWDSRPG